MTFRHVNDPAPANNGWKTCSRGHKYRGPGPCPVCWKGTKGEPRKRAAR